jgi:1,4-dihydroxy-2-naphthoyl-CoA hydrolase
MIWHQKPEIEAINAINQTCLPGHLGIEIVEVGDNYIVATMPIDHRTQQPMGLLHGGASVVLSETLGSIASMLAAGPIGEYMVVGVEVNANHLKAGKSGRVLGTTKAIKIGRNIHVWNTDIVDDQGDLLCTSRLTVMVKPYKQA